MRKVTVITILVLVVLGIGGYLFITNPFNPDVGTVKDLSMKFMEDLQFKDFRSSSLYHHKLERDRVDIGRALERLFLVKPEMLDIREYRIVKAEVDSTAKRARVHVNTKFKRLNMKDKPEEAELILYWIKRHPDCPIGATCSSEGVCADEFGEEITKPKEDEDGRRKEEKQLRDETEVERTEDEYFECDPKAKLQWFMNLDSTLKEKKYNR